VKADIVVKVIDPSNHKETKLYLKEGENLLEAMRAFGLPVLAECGARGRCGKCLIRVVEGRLDITVQDKKILSRLLLSQGYRLACMAYPNQDCTVILAAAMETNYHVIAETLSQADESSIKIGNDSKASYGIAIDIGTTTLAFALVDLAKGNILKKHTATNPQRIYAADVVSRIKASNEGKLELFMKLTGKELLHGISILVKKEQITLSHIQKIIISANTTMIHIFMGYPCEGLATYPFNPHREGFIKTSTDEVFNISESIPIIILPAISAFVGGDISAGLLACGFDRRKKPALLIDLGTNGEIALGNKEKILVTSTSAGPAFEGGNISCGVGSIPGAICHVNIKEGKLSYETIEGALPVGLCGTGVIELTSQLLKEGIIDKTGLLIDRYFDTGYPIESIKFLQEDIRQLQLAKGAIAAGVEILIKKYGISYEELDRVYIAGGFGYHLDVKKAIDIGLLPNSLIDKTEAVGNTALSGAILSLIDFQAEKRLNYIISIAKEINLSNENEFNDLFIQHISF
jgi:uncharacterized 2Fe-2S/4Fe-4S cluster protein (DUF4445 family)